ncbi:MAG: hypothetical protein ACI4PE_03220 [Bacilli bacterium]
MLDKDTLIKVRNRDNGRVGYTIPDLGNLHRDFSVGETKEVTMEELRKLSYIPGGKVILEDCLMIENDEAIAELLGSVEPEYKYSEKEIKYLLSNGTLDQFKDTLDFAPKGVIDLIKDLAVKTELNDVAKRQVILEKTGFNVTKAIEINKETENNDTSDETKVRRATPVVNDQNATGRRSTPVTTAANSKYKIIK